MFFSHQSHTFGHRSLRGDVIDLVGHDFTNQCRARRFSLQYDLARIVTLGKNAGQMLLAVHHQQCANVVFGHDFQRVQNSVSGRNNSQGFVSSSSCLSVFMERPLFS